MPDSLRPTTNPNTPLFSPLDFVMFQVVTLRLILIPWFRTGNVVSFRLWWETGGAGDVGKLNRRRENAPNYTNSGTCFFDMTFPTYGNWQRLVYDICVGVIFFMSVDQRVDDRKLFNTKCLHKDSQWWHCHGAAFNWRLFDVTCLAYAGSGF